MCGAVAPLIRHARVVSAIACLAFALSAGCPATPVATCATDLDCREGSRCVDGRCALEIADAYTAPDAAPENATLIITIIEPDSGLIEMDAR